MASLPESRQSRFPSWWVPSWKLLGHVIGGSLLFAALVVPAVVLDLAVVWMKQTISISDFLAILLTIVKYVIAVLDAFLYLALMIKMGWDFFREIWQLENK
jgi:hypothetical protein